MQILKNNRYVIFIYAFCLVFLTSCRTNTPVENSVTSLVNGNMAEEVNRDDIEKDEKSVEKKLLKIDDVKDCTVYITGETALIGVISDKYNDNEKVKKKVISTVKEDGKIKYVSVTFNESIFDMIDNLKNKK